MNGQQLWFVAFLLYVYDSMTFRSSDAVLRYSIGEVSAAIVTPTLTAGKHRLYIPNPLRPDYCDIQLNENRERHLNLLDRYFIERGSSLYLMHQLLAFSAMISLFVLTPYLATRTSLLRACLIGIGITYWFSMFHWIEMWRNRHLLGINGKALRSDILHVLLCPPNAVNSARRIAALRHARYGALACLRAFSRYDAEKFEDQFLASRAHT